MHKMRNLTNTQIGNLNLNQNGNKHCSHTVRDVIVHNVQLLYNKVQATLLVYPLNL